MVNKISVNLRIKKKNVVVFKNYFELKSSYVFKNSVKNLIKCVVSGLRFVVKFLNISFYLFIVIMGIMGGGNLFRTVIGRDFRVFYRKILLFC